VNLLSKSIGIVVDGHHAFAASLITGRPLQIHTLDYSFSDGLKGRAMLEHWNSKADEFYPPKKKKWRFYDLSTGRIIPDREVEAAIKEGGYEGM